MQARYKRSHSTPGLPNCGPASVTARNLIELKPNCACTLTIATPRTIDMGTLISVTYAPTSTATPASSSIVTVVQAMMSGAGMCSPASAAANTSTPRPSLR